MGALSCPGQKLVPAGHTWQNVEFTFRFPGKHVQFVKEVASESLPRYIVVMVIGHETHFDDEMFLYVPTGHTGKHSDAKTAPNLYNLVPDGQALEFIPSGQY